MGVKRRKMKNITIALPEIYVKNIEKIQEIGLVPSRSEAIRLAIREFLKKEIHNCKLLGYDLQQNQKTS
jgi:Arc/MetJ-type ribon-helix-helix transcriptional regulator